MDGEREIEREREAMAKCIIRLSKNKTRTFLLLRAHRMPPLYCSPITSPNTGGRKRGGKDTRRQGEKERREESRLKEGENREASRLSPSAF